jgi:hypothetical protein
MGGQGRERCCVVGVDIEVVGDFSIVRMNG